MSTDSRTRLIASGGAAAAALMLVFTPRHEGTMLKGYRDPVGIITACMGHTGKAAGLQQQYTQAECDTLLDDDLLQANRVVERCVHVPLTPHQRAAFVDLAFNVGPGKVGVKDGFCALKSGATPTFLRRLNAGDYAGACAGISDWRNPPLPGILRRRADERALCEGRWKPTP